MLCYATLRTFSPPRSALRSEAKCVMQIFEQSKYVYRSTSARANPTGLAE